MTTSDDEKLEEPKAEPEPPANLMDEVHGHKVEQAQASSRMTNSPCVLPTPVHGKSAHKGLIKKKHGLFAAAP